MWLWVPQACVPRAKNIFEEIWQNRMLAPVRVDIPSYGESWIHPWLVPGKKLKISTLEMLLTLYLRFYRLCHKECSAFNKTPNETVFSGTQWLVSTHKISAQGGQLFSWQAFTQNVFHEKFQFGGGGIFYQLLAKVSFQPKSQSPKVPHEKFQFRGRGILGKLSPEVLLSLSWEVAIGRESGGGAYS